jgi:hypothetical protein
MVGGVILARAVNAKESPRILQACREFLHPALDTTSQSHRRAASGRRQVARRTRATPKK